MLTNTVRAIDYEELRVDGYAIQSIEKLFIKNTINNHAEMRLKGILNKETIDDINETTSNKTIEIYYNANKRETLFYGIVLNVKVDVNEEVYEIDITAKSLTYLMDVKKKSRSFQDTTIMLDSLVDTVMNNYTNSAYLLNIPNKKIDELIVQYEETDWDFLKRIFSKNKQGILPTINTKKISFETGTGSHLEKLNNLNIKFEVYKDLKEFNYIKLNYFDDCDEMDYMTYEVTNYAVINLGDYINLNNRKLYVYEAVYEVKNGVLENTYKLRSKKGLRPKTIYNTTIIGSAIQGKVVGVSGEKVQIHLNFDQDNHKDIYWFDFSTLSASSDGSGWYCMPEIGDSMRVYFPTKKENEAFAISSVSSYKNTSGKDRMGDPSNKYLRTKNDKEVRLTPDGILVSCNSGQASLALNSDGTLNIISKNNINLAASNNMKIDSQKSVKITAAEGLNFTCDKNGGLSFDQEGMVKEMGTKVKNN